MEIIDSGMVAEIRPEARGLTDDDVLAAVRREISNATTDVDAEGRESGEGLDNLALDYFHARRPGISEDDRDAGLCDYVSTDVRDAIHATLAEVMPAFGATSPVEFMPAGPDDEDQAQQESEVVNYAIMGLARGHTKIQTAIKDALLLRRGVLKVWVEERSTVEYEEHENVPEEMLPEILAPRTPDERVDIAADEEVRPGIYQTGVVPDPASGMPTIQERQLAGAVYKLEVKRTRKERNFRVDAIPKSELLINRDHQTWDLDEARFVCHQRSVSRSYLVELGFDESLIDEAQSYARGDRADITGDESTQPYMLSECWYRIDADGDGIAELRHIFVLGDEAGSGVLLENKGCRSQPFALGMGYLGLYSSEGISLFDALKIVQDVKTRIIRQVINLGERSLRGRVEVDDASVNMDDLLTSITGGVVRSKRLGSIAPLPEPKPDPTAYKLLELMDAKRRESGGSAIDNASQATQTAGETWRGLERVMGVIEQVNAMVARTLAETLVKTLYLKAHAALREHWTGEIRSRVGNAWRSQMPAQWRPRDQVAARVGLSASERNQMQAVLGGVVQNQLLLVKEGSPLADEGRLHEALIDQLRYAGIPNPHQYYIDPQSREGMQRAQARAQQAQQARQDAAEQSRQQMLVPLRMEEIRARGGVERQAMQNQDKMLERLAKMQQHNDNLTAKYDEMRLKLEELNAKFDREPVSDTLEAAG